MTIKILPTTFAVAALAFACGAFMVPSPASAQTVTTGGSLEQGIQPPPSANAVPPSVQAGTPTTQIGIIPPPPTVVSPSSSSTVVMTTGQPENPKLDATVPVTSGGVADSGLAAIEAAQKEYNTKFVFSGERGMFLSSVGIKLTDSKGTAVVTGKTNGPILLVNLPEGAYTLEASYDTHMKTEKFSVGASKDLKTHQLQFPVKEGQETPVAPAGVTTIKR